MATNDSSYATIIHGVISTQEHHTDHHYPVRLETSYRSSIEEFDMTYFGDIQDLGAGLV